MSSFDIVTADRTHLDDVTRLFDAYRVFYDQASDMTAARDFIQQRLSAGDSRILVAIGGGAVVGFAQLYPSYSSVAMQRVWILNDLFVESSARQQGVASELLKAAEVLARDSSAPRLLLATARDNMGAKSLYERNGWQRDTVFDHYKLDLG